eukprot:COSAG06_NODE_37501_length_434_cov_1.304478_1_plen_83_part_01
MEMLIAACPDGDASSLNAGLGPDGTYFIQEASPVPLVQGTQHAIVHIPADYSVGFQITPSANIISEWASIVHLSATGNNCCAY